MTARKRRTTDSGSAAALNPARSIRAAIARGLTIARAVKIGQIRGVVIGYNIARGGEFPGPCFPLLVETELGTAKFSLDEVIAI